MQQAATVQIGPSLEFLLVFNPKAIKQELRLLHKQEAMCI